VRKAEGAAGGPVYIPIFMDWVELYVAIVLTVILTMGIVLITRSR
jgi:hypothetical protein